MDATSLGEDHSHRKGRNIWDLTNDENCNEANYHMPGVCKMMGNFPSLCDDTDSSFLYDFMTAFLFDNV